MAYGWKDHLKDLWDRVTATRAGYLDRLNAAISVVGSPYSHPDSLVETDALIVAAATQIVDIEFDMNNLAQVTTIREYVQVNGADYRQVTAVAFPTDFDTGTKSAIYQFFQKGQLYKITFQSSVAEGAAKDVPYRIMTRQLGT